MSTMEGVGEFPPGVLSAIGRVKWRCVLSGGNVISAVGDCVAEL